MDVSVEFAGVSRILAGTRGVSLSLQDGTTFREILGLLGSRYPELLGHVIDPSENTLYASTALSLNGKYMVPLERIDESPRDGDRLIFLSLMAGG